MAINDSSAVQRNASFLKYFFAALMLLAVLVSAEHTRRWFRALPTDLRAFYAAGQVIDQHADPFTVQPLLEREQSLAVAGASQPIVAPVPLPPYDLAALSFLAVLPVFVAAAAAAACTIAAGFLTAFALYRAAEIPFTLAVAVSFTATVYSASALGQIAPLAIAAIAIATWAVREERYAVAGVALGLSLMQPQIAAAPFLSLLMFVPKARVAALVCAGLAAVMSYAVIGPALILQYAHVLSLHARSEVHFPAQLSLTWLLAFFGAPPGAALALGGASTTIALIAALIMVARNRVPAVASGAVVSLPAAFTVIGGSFLHEHQLALILVPGLLSLRTTRAISDSSWALGVVLIPFMSLLTLEPRWPKGGAYPSIALAFVVCWALLYTRAIAVERTTAVRKASLVTGGIAMIFLLLAVMRPHLHIAVPVVTPLSNENASLEWAVFCDAAAAAYHTAIYVLLVKIPVWASALTIAICAARNVGRVPSPHEVASCT